MGSRGVADYTDLRQILEAETPPDDNQGIIYGVEQLRSGMNVLHGPSCEARASGDEFGAVKVRKTNGRTLQQALKTDRAVTACTSCYEDLWTHADMLARRSQKLYEALEAFHWTQCSLLLCYETSKAEHVEQWAHWLCRKTPEQIRAQAQRELGWSRKRRGLIVCFEANGCDETSWAVGAGDHVAVKRTGGLNQLAVHGLLPGDAGGCRGQVGNEILVAVDEGFKEEHLRLAVHLYEADEIRSSMILSGRQALQKDKVSGQWQFAKADAWVARREMAHRVVQSARLILA